MHLLFEIHNKCSTYFTFNIFVSLLIGSRLYLNHFLPQNVGSIVNKSFDFSPCGFIMNLERTQFIDFTSPLFENRIGNFVNMNKQSRTSDWAFFIRPFNNTSWIYCLGNKLELLKCWPHSELFYLGI